MVPPAAGTQRVTGQTESLKPQKTKMVVDVETQNPAQNRWIKVATKRLEDHPNGPVVIVAASGGGSRAALATALTLEQIEKAFDSEYPACVWLCSGVYRWRYCSGGTLLPGTTKSVFSRCSQCGLFSSDLSRISCAVLQSRRVADCVLGSPVSMERNASVIGKLVPPTIGLWCLRHQHGAASHGWISKPSEFLVSTSVRRTCYSNCP